MCILVINCKCGNRKKVRRLPLQREFGNYFVNITILALVYVEHCQSGSLIVLRRGVFESLHAAKTAFGCAGGHGIR